MKPSEIFRYYKREDIKREIVRVAKDREVVPLLMTGEFGSRPQTIFFAKDYDEIVKEGVASLHLSIERWENPSLLRSEMKKKELDELRIGWDLLIDVDSKNLEFSRICSQLVIEALELHGIRSISVKFSGRNGFHLAVPYETFPKVIGGREVKNLFPEAPRVIASYLKEMIRKNLAEEILKKFSMDEVVELSGVSREELIDEEIGLNPYKVVDIDPVAISSRHLFRAPFSLHEKTWLVSLPIRKEDLKKFSREDAKVENLEFRAKFLDLEKVRENEAKELFIQAFDWFSRRRIEEEVSRQIGEKFQIPKKAVPKELFPPCIKSILRGLSDGRKRSVFILINFLKLLGYDWDSIEKILKEWNQRNVEPLKERYIETQLRWHKKLKEVYIPPNCDNENYYRSIGVCFPDEICKKIKNPLTYPFKKRKRR